MPPEMQVAWVLESDFYGVSGSLQIDGADLGTEHWLVHHKIEQKPYEASKGSRKRPILPSHMNVLLLEE